GTSAAPGTTLHNRPGDATSINNPAKVIEVGKTTIRTHGPRTCTGNNPNPFWVGYKVDCFFRLFLHKRNREINNCPRDFVIGVQLFNQSPESAGHDMGLLYWESPGKATCTLRNLKMPGV